jgi:hypothetical protein
MHVTKSSLVLSAALIIAVGGGTSSGQEKNPPFSLDDPQSKRAVVSVVGPIKITADEFRLSYEFGPAFAKRTKDARQRYLSYMINEKLLALGAMLRKEEVDPLVEPALAEIEGDLATEELYKDDVQSKVKVSRAEIYRGVEQSKRHLSLQWIFAPTKDEGRRLATLLRRGASFDSLYRLQGPDSVLSGNRSIEATLFQIRMKNQEIGNVADTLKPGRTSALLKGPDGWYILKIANTSQEFLPTESDEAKLRDDVSRALLQQKSDSVSEQYVNALMKEHHPVIVPQTFDLLSSYLALKFLDPSRAVEWGLVTDAAGGKDSASLQAIDNHGEMPLVNASGGVKIPLNEFLRWYRDREYLIALEKTSKQAYHHSLAQMVWRMVRDKLLVDRAFHRNLQNREAVRSQKKWWEEKLLFEVEKKSIQDSISFSDKILEAYFQNNRRHYKDPKGEALSFTDAKEDVLRDYFEFEMTKRTLHKINAMKAKYTVTVSDSVLARIPVDGDPKAIDLYTVKKGGTFPRPAFPVIDMMWETWR